jgi:hypothetical protein
VKFIRPNKHSECAGQHESELNEPRHGFFPARQPLVGHRRVADGDHGVHVFLPWYFQQILYPAATSLSNCIGLR